MTSKKFSLITTLLLLQVSISLAQFVPMTSTMRTPYGNVPITNYVFMPYHYGNKGTGAISYKDDFYIIYKNDSIQKVFTKIIIKDSVHYFSLKNNKTDVIIKPSDTKSVYVNSENGKIVGIPSDTCWLFKTNSGKINSYTFIAELHSPYVIAIQKGDSAIVALSKDNLLSMVKENPKAVKYVEKENFLKAISVYNKRGDVGVKKDED